MENTQLSSSVTVKQYRVFKDNENIEKISDLILERFQERYISPFINNQSKHGFSMMAICCLMVEALHSFKKGWKRTGVKGGAAFEDFFSTSRHLRIFQGSGEEFYSCVRCGILHQAETYNGWKIVRRGALLDKENKTVNATRFLTALDNELNDYVTSLKTESLDSIIWKKAIRKLDHICSNSNA